MKLGLSVFLLGGFLSGCSFTLRTPPTVSGVVQLGRVKNAVIQVYALNPNGTRIEPPLEEVETNTGGAFFLKTSLPLLKGPIEIVAKAHIKGSTHYKDEISRESISFDQGEALSAVIDQSGSKRVAITPMSSMVADRVIFELGRTGSAGRSFSDIKKEALSQAGQIWGLSPSEMEAIPADSEKLIAGEIDPTTVSDEELKATLVLFSLSQFFVNMNKASSILSETSTNPGSPVRLLRGLSEDALDKKLDGKNNRNLQNSLHSSRQLQSLTSNEVQVEAIATSWTPGMAAAQEEVITNYEYIFSRFKKSSWTGVSHVDPPPEYQKPGPPGTVSGIPKIGSVDLSWEAPSPATPPIQGYLIEQSEDGINWRPARPSWVAVADPDAANNATSTATGLENGREYFFRVAAANNQGVGIWSEISSPLVPDNIPPTVTLTSSTLNPTNGTIAVSVTFSEPVTGFDASDISVTNGSVGSFVPVSSTVYTYVVTPSVQGTVSTSVSSNKAQDIAGNNNTASNEITRAFDSVLPSVSLTSSTLNPTNGTIAVSVTFSEPVTGFDASDISVTNGSVGSFVPVSSTVYTYVVTPSVQGTVSTSVSSNKAQDIAGNNNTASNTLNFTYDITPPSSPSISINSAASYTNITLVDLTLSATGSPLEMYVTNTAGCGSGEGSAVNWESYATSKTAWVLSQTNTTATVYVKFKDAAGNVSDCVSDTIDHDNTAPSLASAVIDNGATYSNAASPFLASLNLSATDNFSVSQMKVSTGVTDCSGGTWVSFSANSNINLSPNATNTVSVRVKDSAGNESTCLSDTIIHDNQKPTATVAFSSVGSSSAVISLQFNETISSASLALGDLSISTGSASSLSGSGTSYSFTATPNGLGSFSIHLPVGTVQDLSGNTNEASNTISLAPPQPARNIQVSSVNDSTVTIQWIAPSSDGGMPVLEYLIYSSTNSGDSFTLENSVSSSTFSTTISGLNPGLSYVFGVSAKNAVGEGTGGTSENLTLKHFQPVLAVRAMGCINCHAKGTSVVTDFGKGDSFQMDGYYSGNHHNHEGWSLSEFTKITVPTISSSILNQWAVANTAQDTCEPGRHQEFYFESILDESITTHPISGEVYRIKSVFTSWDLFAGGIDDGNPIWFHPRDVNRTENQWKLLGNQTDGFQLESLHAPGKCALIGWGNVKDRWATAHLLTCDSNAANQKFKLHPSSTAQSVQVKAQHNTDPNAYCLEVPGGDYADPKEPIRKFISKRSVLKNPTVEVNVLDADPFIGAPTRTEMLVHLNVISSHDWFYRKNKPASPDLNVNPVFTGGSATAFDGFYEISGDITCDGDLAFKKPLIIKNLNLSTLHGCRIYVAGPVFQQGPITYVSLDANSNLTNLQIISSDFISQGIGTTHCETAGGFSWYHGAAITCSATHCLNPLYHRLVAHRPTLRASYFSDAVGYWDSLKNDFSAMGIEDASCRLGGDPTKTNLERRTLTFERLMLVAPMVQSRYIGNFKGVIVAEFVNFTLSQFDFTFDPVFGNLNVGVLPLVPSTQYLNVD